MIKLTLRRFDSPDRKDYLKSNQLVYFNDTNNNSISITVDTLLPLLPYKDVSDNLYRELPKEIIIRVEV